MNSIDEKFKKTSYEMGRKKKEEKEYLEKFVKEEKEKKIKLKILDNKIDEKNEYKHFKENCLDDFNLLLANIKKVYKDLCDLQSTLENPFTLEDNIKMNKSIKVIPGYGYPDNKTIITICFCRSYPDLYNDNLKIWEDYKDKKKEYYLAIYEEDLTSDNPDGFFDLISQEKFKIKNKQKAYDKFIDLFQNKILVK
jgi:hypothetical protein